MVIWTCSIVNNGRERADDITSTGWKPRSVFSTRNSKWNSTNSDISFYNIHGYFNSHSISSIVLYTCTFVEKSMLATIVYRSLNGMAPHYLAADLWRLSDMPSRRRLRLSLTHQLDVRQSQCTTVGDRTFAVAGARLWNSLPPDIVACDTLPLFRRELKTFLLDSLTLLFLIYFFPRGPCGF